MNMEGEHYRAGRLPAFTSPPAQTLRKRTRLLHARCCSACSPCGTPDVALAGRSLLIGRRRSIYNAWHKSQGAQPERPHLQQWVVLPAGPNRDLALFSGCEQRKDQCSVGGQRAASGAREALYQAVCTAHS